MSFEDLQKAWQSQGGKTKVLIDADALLREVRRNHQQFQLTIFWRDFREVGAALFLAIYLFQRGFETAWTDWLLALACFGVGAFLVVDRLRQRGARPLPNDELKTCLESSRDEVRHQIWLLRSIAWWYLLPLAAGLAVSIVYSARHALQPAAHTWLGWGAYTAFCVALIGGVYWLNQFAVRKTLEPRLREIEMLLAELQGS